MNYDQINNLIIQYMLNKLNKYMIYLIYVNNKTIIAKELYLICYKNLN
jgi:hypothetical protein